MYMCRDLARSCGGLYNMLNMKRFLLIICILVPCLSCKGGQGGAARESRISTAVSECRHYEGADYLKLGSLATGALKGVVRLAGAGDSDIKEAVSLLKGIDGLTVFSYDDCSPEDRALIDARLSEALAGSEMLLEASDSGQKLRMYGTYDERTDKVRDFVLFAPSESALICVRGSVSMDTVARIASDD